MSPLAVRKNLISSHPTHAAARHSARYSSRRARLQTSDDRIPPQGTMKYNEPAASDVLASPGPLDPVVRTVSVKEAAFRLRKSTDSIYTWLRHGRLQGWQPGGPGCQIQVMESSVEQALKNMLGACATAVNG